MDLLDRLLGHDHDTTGELLLRCEELSPAELHKEFDIGWRSAHRTFVHMISNVQVWTDLIAGRPEVTDTDPWWDADLSGLQALHESSYADFTAVARLARERDRMGEDFIDYLDQPPAQKTIGAGVLHVITHNMHHRSELIHILTRLGIEDPPEGDLMGWDMAERKAVTT
jgi:uncharacterized damage-inducible protein DinB